MNTTTSPSSDRLWFLDWVRVGAFALLIPYHLGMFYVSWDWHVKSSYDGSAVEPLMLVTAPFRLALLFLVSGAATRFLAERVTTGGFAWSRIRRLLPPLLFGMFVICAPQAYFEGLAKDGLQPGFFDFLPRYWGFGAALKHGFTWNHLWFVAYLLAYSLLLAPLLKPLRRLGESRVLTSTVAIVLLPALLTGIGYALTRLRFQVTHDLIADWPSHVVFLPLFLFGFTVARSQRFWDSAERIRWFTFVVALAGYAILLWAYLLPDDAPRPVSLHALRVIRCAYAWMAILTVLGFARRYLNRPNATVAWLNRGVFCFYIVHQTAIVLFGVLLAPLKIGPVLEPVAILMLTVTSCLGIYALAARFGPAKLLFGLPPRAVRSRTPRELATI